jgi:excisionase family DNA binding protein
MPYRTLTTDELTEYLHLNAGDVERLLRETDIPHERRGGRIAFRRSEIDEWASRRLLHLPGKPLDIYHEKSMRATRDLFPGAALIPELLRTEYIDLALTSKTQSSVVRDMVALATQTARVLDPRELATSVRERETLCSTALPGGLALLHARHLAPYRFEGSFIVLGRTIQPVPFGAPDGRPTQLFFLICCDDDRIHLHALARLCLLAMKTDVVSRLHAAENAAAAFDALVNAEKSVLPPPTGETTKRARRGAA